MMRRLLMSAAVAASMLVAFAGPTAAITNDWRVDNEHNFVGLVAFYDEDGEFIHR